MGNFYEKVKERLIRYVKIFSESKANTNQTPSTLCQYDLAKILEAELKEIGASNVWLDMDHCIVYATIPSNIKEDVISVGLIAHMDTAPDVTGKNVKPWVLDNYQGDDVILNKELNIVMSCKEFPNLKKYIGQDIVFTDGTTLLGGDDKAAISEIMTMAEYLINNPQIKHGPIQIAFTPDEEVGGLAKDLDFKRFGADIAYTVDGDYVGYYSDETFNATEAQLFITGKNVHPGTAKGIMKNAVEIAVEFINMLPLHDRPYLTKGREGFYHPHVFEGIVEKAKVFTLIRDHDYDNFEKRKDFIKECVDKLNKKYGEGTVLLQFANGYYSMKKVVDKYPFMIEKLVEAIKESRVDPVHLPFRGGTDGSAISNRGLPCPNISAGYENGHSRYEFVPIQSMEKITEILINLIKKLAEVKK